MHELKEYMETYLSYLKNYVNALSDERKNKIYEYMTDVVNNIVNEADKYKNQMPDVYKHAVEFFTAFSDMPTWKDDEKEFDKNVRKQLEHLKALVDLVTMAG